MNQHAHEGRPDAAAPTIDPVCGMVVDPVNPKGGQVDLDGRTYRFCSSRCREKLAASPSTFLASAAPTSAALSVKQIPPHTLILLQPT